MERETITIEEIKSNPNLDLTERINKFSKDKRWNANDLKELAIASIKQEYEFWANKRDNISSRTDELLKQILNGHILSKSEEFEMVCTDEEKVNDYSKYEKMKQRIVDNNGVTLDDFNELCKTIGFDSKTAELIRTGFESRGKIIDSYEDTNNVIANNHKITKDFLYKLCETAGFDAKTIELIRTEFENKGLLIDSQEEKETYHR